MAHWLQVNTWEPATAKRGHCAVRLERAVSSPRPEVETWKRGYERANGGSGDPPSLLTGQWERVTGCHTLMQQLHRSPPTSLILSVPPRIFFLFPFKHTIFLLLLLLLPPPSFFLPVDRVSAWDGISPVCRTHGKNFRKCTPHLPTHQKKLLIHLFFTSFVLLHRNLYLPVDFEAFS